MAINNGILPDMKVIHGNSALPKADRKSAKPWMDAYRRSLLNINKIPRNKRSIYEASSILKEAEYYDVLQISSNASEKEIRKALRQVTQNDPQAAQNF
ncbi:hypothetical protein FRX31_014912 [Thalictrum thalictroides]|uniref:Uncharacterized protein n=1 Tax=Thalictrum thalictroides TaxID=46969 RepID=A0A7J6WDU2_THATH|nr:hypothetical protein FRX31_014912 [Thalictrum thalictroides]